MFGRLVRAALLCWPASVRDRDGGEMEAAATTVWAERRRRGAGAAAAFGVRVLVDLVVEGVRERARRRQGREGGMGRGDGWTDLRVAARTLARTPGFTVTAILVVALGVGANTAIFSAVKATLLAEPPYPEPERLAFLDLADSSTVAPEAASGRAAHRRPRTMPWSYPKYLAFRETRDLPVELSAAYARRGLTLTGVGDATFLNAEYVTPEYLRMLGAAPALGRDFVAGDDVEGAELVAILGHALWRGRFGADPGVVGADITLNGRQVRVVGVAPAGFRGLTGTAELWMTACGGASLTAPFVIGGARAHWLRVVARLAPGTDIALLDHRMRDVGRAVEERYPDTDPTVVHTATAQSFAEATVNPQAKKSLLVLTAAAALLLLVACANLAGLLVARAGARARETAVRVALGAGRWRVTRTFLAEALLLASAGGLVGLAVAALGLDALAALWPSRFVDASWNVRAAGVASVGLDLAVVVFAALAALLTGLVFGVVPALSVAAGDPADRLRAGASTARGGRGILDLRRALVTAEVAMALVLMVGAGRLLRSLSELNRVGRGFEPGDLLAFEFAIPRTSPWAEDEAAFHERYLERLRAIPGVEGAALVCVPPLGGHCMITGVREAGDRTWGEGSRPSIGVHYVSDDFFSTLGIPVLEGRTFTSEDQTGSRPVVVLSAAAARELFPDGVALGRTIAMGTGLTSEERGPAEIVGVVGDVLFDRPANGIMPEAYISHRQDVGSGSIVLRTRGDPLGFVPAARAALAEVDADVPLFGARSVDDLEAEAAGDTHVMGLLLTVFAALALLLGCTGVWAVVAFAVARRTREIGVRMALGADGRAVVRSVLRQGLGVSVLGVLLGGAGGWAASRVLRSLLFGVGPADLTAYVGASATVLVVATLAAWLPARRATRVDPMVVLRSE